MSYGYRTGPCGGRVPAGAPSAPHARTSPKNPVQVEQLIVHNWWRRQDAERACRGVGVRDGWLRVQGRARWRRGLARMGCSRLEAIAVFLRRHICRFRDRWRMGYIIHLIASVKGCPRATSSNAGAWGRGSGMLAVCTGQVPKGRDRVVVIQTPASARWGGGPSAAEDQPACTGRVPEGRYRDDRDPDAGIRARGRRSVGCSGSAGVHPGRCRKDAIGMILIRTPASARWGGRPSAVEDQPACTRRVPKGRDQVTAIRTQSLTSGGRTFGCGGSDGVHRAGCWKDGIRWV